VDPIVDSEVLERSTLPGAVEGELRQQGVNQVGENVQAEGTETSRKVPPELPARDPKACQSTPGEGPEMVVIPAGVFVMGSPSGEAGRDNDEGPQRQVLVTRPFAMSRCEVTVAEFRQFVEETGYKPSVDGCYVWDAAKGKAMIKQGAGWRAPGFSQSAQDPVVCVNWNDANAYAKWLSQRTGANYRLPSEAEWEYAARAGTTTSRYWGEASEKACQFANVYDQVGEEAYRSGWEAHQCSDGQANTAPVGSYYPNGFGLYDMLGNVWEWGADCWFDNYEGAGRDTSARRAPEGEGCAERVVRGGGWLYGPADVRSANRFGLRPDGAGDNLGFRLARTLP
jgi:formylglycine-generating enzyme required for sulfatase activity